MSLYCVSRLNLITEIEEDQFCEVAGINYHELIVVIVLSKRIAYKNDSKTKSYDLFVYFIRSHNIVASRFHPFPWSLAEHSGFISQQG
jgi:hypothetical protein